MTYDIFLLKEREGLRKMFDLRLDMSKNIFIPKTESFLCSFEFFGKDKGGGPNN